MKIKPNVYFDPKVETGGNGSAPATKTASTLTNLPKPVMPSAPSAARLAIDFDVAQLPPLDGGEGDSKVTIEPKTTDNTTKTIDTNKEEPKADEVSTTDTTASNDTTKEEVKTPSSILKAPKTEDKKGGDKKTTTGEVIKSITPVKGEGAKEAAFDYTGFEEQEVTHLRNMSKLSREYTAKLIRDNKKLAGANYLQHPDAYTLSPEYRQVQENIYYSNKEAQIRAEQLTQCKLGKPFKDLVGFDANGNPKWGNEITPNDNIEEELRLSVSNCRNLAQQFQGQLQQYPQQFKQRVQTDLQQLHAERANRFEWVKNPKLEDYTLTIEGVGEKSIKDVKKDVASLFPSYMRNSVAVEVCGDLMVALRIQAAQLAEAQSGKTVSDTKVEDAKRAEPNSVTKPAAPDKTVNGVKEFSVAGLEI